MFSVLRRFLYKILGLNLLEYFIQSEFESIRRELKGIKSEHQDIAKYINDAVQRKIDERLDHYFKWKLPIHLSSNNTVFIHTNDGHRLYLDLREPFMALHMLEHGEWETPLRRELAQILTEGNVFIDVGANIGLHSLYASSLVGRNGAVIALEPHPVTFKLLRKNIEINGLLDHVKTLPLAISNQDDETVPFEYFVEHPAMSGLKISKEILDKFEGTLEITNVKTITIDTLVSRHSVKPDLVKIDVEGFEFSVIEGCKNTIDLFPQLVFFIEYEKIMAESVMQPGIGKEIANFFESRGFLVSRIDAQQLTRLTYSEFVEESRGDYIFKREPTIGIQ